MNLWVGIFLAKDFVEHHYPNAELISAIKKDNHFEITFDIGFLKIKEFRITIIDSRIMQVETLKN